MQNKLNTRQARELVATVTAEKNIAIWDTWTNAVWKDCAKVADKRNLCFGNIEERFTEVDCKQLKQLVGCDKVHTTMDGRYLRLVGVKYES
jgi:hypothetical protein